ncbi:MAG: Ig-like domain-containing protein [Burkholderiales bacterium]|nr:Ig-like domain-containing protein [Burkholderiales bacterium]
MIKKVGYSFFAIVLFIIGCSNGTSKDTPGYSASIDSISITPARSKIAEGFTQQYTAMAIYSDGTIIPIASDIKWVSSDPNIATINSSGLATVTAMSGTTYITATYNGITSTAASLVATNKGLISSVSISPTQSKIAEGFHQQYLATVTYLDGTTSPITSDIKWNSSATNVATINSSGLATVTAMSGTTYITATYSGITSTAATLIATDKGLISSVSISPVQSQIAEGFTQQYTAMAIYSDGTTSPITGDIKWISSSSNIAIIDNSGLATVQVSNGTSYITAKYAGITSTAAILEAVSWIAMGSGAISAFYGVNSLAFNNSGNLFAAVTPFSGLAGVLEWDENGWIAVGGNNSIPSFTSANSIVFDSKNNLYVGGGAAVWKWESDATTWTEVGNGNIPSAINIFSLAIDKNDTLYAGGTSKDPITSRTVGTVWRLLDNTWILVGESTLSSASSEVTSIKFSNDGTLYAGGGTLQDIAAVWKLNGNVWNNIGILPETSSVNAIAFDSGNNLYAIGTTPGPPTAIVWIWDGRTKWNIVGNASIPFSFSGNSIAFDSNDNLYASGVGIDSSGGNFAAVWQWGGTIWKVVCNSYIPYSHYATPMVFDSNGSLYVGGSSSIYDTSANVWVAY